MAGTDAPKWSEIKKKLSNLSSPEMNELVKSLYDFSKENKLFLAARFSESGEAAALEEYRERVVQPFFPKRGFGKLNLAAGRKAIRDYRKATSDLSGTLDLMITYVESGTRFTNEYGDIEEAFYNSLESTLGEAVELFKTPEGRLLYPKFEPRLDRLVKKARQIGWGYGDYVSDEIESLEEWISEQPGDSV